MPTNWSDRHGGVIHYDATCTMYYITVPYEEFGTEDQDIVVNKGHRCSSPTDCVPQRSRCCQRNGTLQAME